jgi:gamma-glutamylcyclotransferase (GGCT)/AIG2-like uncharacterized protein YtfP
LSDKPESIRHLFVYGTLMRAGGSPYAKLLRSRARFLCEATARGRLHHLGRYPGAVFDPFCRSRIQGELYRIGSPYLLGTLDAYEGCRPGDPAPQLFRREIVKVDSVRGRVSAWAYRFTGNTAGRPIIATGRFQSR